MLSCKEVSHLVSESLDGKLPFWQGIQVRLHLLMCRFCTRFRKQTLFLRNAAHHYLIAVADTEPAANTGLSPEARDRIKRFLKPDRT
jgi:hypothetical protein